MIKLERISKPTFHENSIDYTQKAPNDVMKLIFHRLSFSDLKVCGCINKRWRQLSRDCLLNYLLPTMRPKKPFDRYRNFEDIDWWRFQDPTYFEKDRFLYVCFSIKGNYFCPNLYEPSVIAKWGLERGNLIAKWGCTPFERMPLLLGQYAMFKISLFTALEGIIVLCSRHATGHTIIEILSETEPRDRATTKTPEWFDGDRAITKTPSWFHPIRAQMIDGKLYIAGERGFGVWDFIPGTKKARKFYFKKFVHKLDFHFFDCAIQNKILYAIARELVIAFDMQSGRDLWCAPHSKYIPRRIEIFDNLLLILTNCGKVLIFDINANAIKKKFHDIPTIGKLMRAIERRRKPALLQPLPEEKSACIIS